MLMSSIAVPSSVGIAGEPSICTGSSSIFGLGFGTIDASSACPGGSGPPNIGGGGSVNTNSISLSLFSKQIKAGHYMPISEAPFKWRFAGGPILDKH